MVGLTSGRRILLMMATAVMIGVSAVAPRVAERGPPGGGPFHQGGRTIQDYTNTLIDEYKTASDTRREEILAELRNWGMTWIQIGCRDVFGDISVQHTLHTQVPALQQELLDGTQLVEVGGPDEVAFTPSPIQDQNQAAVTPSKPGKHHHKHHRKHNR